MGQNVLNKNAFDAMHDVQGSVFIEYPDKHFILCHSACFFNGFGRLIRIFKAGKKKGIVKGIIFKREIFGKGSVKICLVSQSFTGNIQHIGGGVNAGEVQAEVVLQELLKAPARAAADLQNSSVRLRGEHF